jgi:NDP-sugar pyrophosphorylase family protein
MKALIFAAGMGTRLKPLTDNCPKALVHLNGKPLIWYAINNLKRAGIGEVVVNIHHHALMLSNYLLKTDFGLPVHISDESALLLDTGGGLLKARPFLDGDEPFIAINVDVISSLDLREVMEFHQNSDPLATLVVRNRETGRLFLFDEDMHLSGWKNFITGEEKAATEKFYSSHPFAFSGIHVISPSIFDLITETGMFSIVELYLRLAKDNIIMGYNDTSDFWLDLGKPGQLEIAEEYLATIRNSCIFDNILKRKIIS